MTKLYKMLVLVCLLCVASMAVASVGEDIKEGVDIKAALIKAVADGMTIDQAVFDAVSLNPQLAEAIVVAAHTLLQTLPDGAFEVFDEDGKPLIPPQIDREGSSARIIQEALAANPNLDPNKIAAAAAAGVTGGKGGPGVAPGPGDGNRGGNIASPS